MGVNKVTFYGEELINLENDTVTPETLIAGTTATNSNGEKITGTFDPNQFVTHNQLSDSIDEALTQAKENGEFDGEDGLPGIVISEEEPSAYPDGEHPVWLHPDGEEADSLATMKDIESKVEKSDLINLIYPIGSIYMSVNNVSPQTFLGGTWERIQDRFLLSAGSSYTAGTTGGEATHTLTVDEMPSHTHAQLGASGGLANSSPVRQVFQGDGNVVVYASDGSVVYATMKMTDAPKTYRTTTINEDGLTGAIGGGKAHNNMPPYLAVYIWKRTA